MPIKSKKSRTGSKNVLKRTDIVINNNINNDNIVFHQSRYHQYCMRCTTVETTDYGYLNYDSNDDENYIEVLDDILNLNVVQHMYYLMNQIFSNKRNG